jgi:tRNA uridine 5-carbamoylmethylation protein Kti12
MIMHKPETGKWTLTAVQQKELEKKDWEAIPNARFLDLYHDDFQDGAWDEVCQVFDKEKVADKLTLLVVGVKTNE